jgi:eukaryotic-like serine/threonine-protein kinase
MFREAQALAKLDHPNVVAVHEVGAVGEDIYLTMDFVEGETLKEWWKAAQPGWKQVLEVMIAAGRGIAAAHKVGIIHRDVKPSNIMVGRDGRVRVLDFGLARSTAASLMDSPLPVAELTPARGEVPAPEEPPPAPQALRSKLTQEGNVLGTPGYMAPEQYVRAEPSPATDQFSFCATLYEALFGKKPFSGRSYHALRYKVLTGRIAPPPESSKVPSWLRRIVFRGLSVKGGERYPSMEALLEELSRDPWARWRRGMAAALMVLVLGAGYGLSAMIQARERAKCQGFETRLSGVWDDGLRERVRSAFLKTERHYAADTFDRVRKVLDGYTAAWLGMKREACEATQVRGEQSAKLMDLKMLCLNRRLEEARALTEVLVSRSDAATLDKVVQASMGLKPLGQCADERALLSDVPPPEEAPARQQVEEIRKRLDEAEALQQTGKYQEGLRLAEGALAATGETAYRPVVAEALYQVGSLLERVGRYPEAAQDLRQAVKVADAAGHDKLRAKALNTLIYVVGYQQARFDEAEPFMELAGLVIERILDQGEIKARWLNNLGAVAYIKGDYDLALSHHERALKIWEATLGPAHPDVATSHNNLGLALFRKGEYDRALAHFDQAAAIWERSLGPAHPDVALSHNNQGMVFDEKGELDRALAHHQRALEIREKALGPNHPDVATSLNNVGIVLFEQGLYDRARESQERALKIMEASLGSDHPDLSWSLSGLGWIDLIKDRRADARGHFERVLSLCGTGSAAPAAPHGAGRCQGGEKEPLADAQFGLAQVLWRKGERSDRALALAAQALQFFKTRKSVRGLKMRKDAEAWLRERVGHP